MSIADRTTEILGHLTESYQVFDRSGRILHNGDVCLFMDVDQAIEYIGFMRTDKEIKPNFIGISTQQKHRQAKKRARSAHFDINDPRKANGRHAKFVEYKHDSTVNPFVQCGVFFYDYRRKQIKFIFGNGHKGGQIVRSIFENDLNQTFVNRDHAIACKRIMINCVAGDYSQMDDNWKKMSNFDSVVESWKSFSKK